MADGPTVPASYFWGLIQSQVGMRASTQSLYRAIRRSMGLEGISAVTNMFADVTRLRSIAAGNRTAMENLMGATADTAITSDMIGLGVNARSLNERNALPRYQVRFEHVTTANGIESTDWRTVTYDLSVPATQGELINDLTAVGQQMADDYGVESTGVGNYVILAV